MAAAGAELAGISKFVEEIGCFAGASDGSACLPPGREAAY